MVWSFTAAEEEWIREEMESSKGLALARELQRMYADGGQLFKPGGTNYIWEA